MVLTAHMTHITPLGSSVRNHTPCLRMASATLRYCTSSRHIQYPSVAILPRQRGSARCKLTRQTCQAGDEATQQPRVALEGDLVFVHFDCKDEDGKVLESTRGPDMEPISFEVGAGELFANEMIKGFDVAVRGLEIGGRATIKASGKPWQKELMFQVPRDHPEVARLEGRYKNVGGLAPELVVELANGSQAMVIELTDEYLRLDANSFVAGRELDFEIELVSFEPPNAVPAPSPERE